MSFGTALVKILSLYGITDKYINVFSATCENNTAAVKAGNKVSSWFPIIARV